MRIIVCGGRQYGWLPKHPTDEDHAKADRERSNIFNVLDKLHAEDEITDLGHGAAPGADLISESWAKSRQVDYRGYPAKWKQFKQAAGGMRNKRMLRKFMQYEKVDVLVAFPGGFGTANMVKLAEEVGVRVEHG